MHRRAGTPTPSQSAAGPTVSSLNVDRSNCTDDGELFVANYND